LATMARREAFAIVVAVLLSSLAGGPLWLAMSRPQVLRPAWLTAWSAEHKLRRERAEPMERPAACGTLEVEASPAKPRAARAFDCEHGPLVTQAEAVAGRPPICHLR
jgi:hypothetical protein